MDPMATYLYFACAYMLFLWVSSASNLPSVGLVRTILKVLPIAQALLLSLRPTARGRLKDVQSNSKMASVRYAPLIATGLVFSGCGDICLELEGLANGVAKEALFLGGLTSFLLGHLAYVRAFKCEAAEALQPGCSRSLSRIVLG